MFVCINLTIHLRKEGPHITHASVCSLVCKVSDTVNNDQNKLHIVFTRKTKMSLTGHTWITRNTCHMFKTFAHLKCG